MKKLLIMLFFIMVVFLPSLSCAEPTMLLWGAANGIVEGYIVHSKNMITGEERKHAIDNVLFVKLSDLKLDETMPYELWVIAFNSVGEGLGSNIVVYNLKPPGAPKNARVGKGV